MKAFYETKEFKTLDAEWKLKLKESGFSDIEIGESDTVIKPEIIKVDSSQYHSGLDYADFCQQILREYRFKKDIHRVIFEKHTNSRSDREIVAEIRDEYKFNVSQQSVNYVIKSTKENFLKGER